MSAPTPCARKRRFSRKELDPGLRRGDGVVAKVLATFAIGFTLLLAGCQRPPPVEQTPLKPQSPAELQSYIISQKPNVDVFRPRGPFAYEKLRTTWCGSRRP